MIGAIQEQQLSATAHYCFVEVTTELLLLGSVLDFKTHHCFHLTQPNVI
jgi:hypothetical protein